MATPYTSIYAPFLSKISDPYLASLSDTDFSEQLLKFLNSSVPKFKKCKKDLSFRTVDGLGFEKDLTDEEIEILANLMVIEWLRPLINNLEILKHNMIPREFNSSSQGNFLRELQALRKDTQAEISKLLVDYSYNNNSLDDLYD